MSNPAECQSVEPTEPTFSAWLKEGTNTTHESLDQRIMSLSPFSNRERYALFVRTQSRLHQAVSDWFQSDELNNFLPGLKERDRSEAVLQDCADFEMPESDLKADQQAAAEVTITDFHSALGWLYVVEGSNLGAAFLLKYARKHLDLSEEFGARHLAGHEDGRGLHWRQFKTALDALELNQEQKEVALNGAKQAFAFARQNVEQLLAPATP
ncbi:biliverdin-producing heme oxygenase [Microbulbifer sp. SSSA008]|uniref:biliverdin-producing heme oxygenase n=1 Tax=unclassified Microbulbifer TaxID=2619833 RepID=UPI002B2937C3|nr:biliverdin-producing heme oxygenase [Microbulbifer sp. MKSA007]